MNFFRISLVIFTLLILSISVTHAYVFPQETSCILIDFYDFEKDGSLYYRKGLSAEKIEKLNTLILLAEERVGQFWGQKTVNPKYIYCDNAEDYRRFGSSYPSPACAHMKLGAYVVLSKEGFDLDILAHEISHTELFQRIGFFNRLQKIPTWFDEGLAMQVDYRAHYSKQELALLTNDLQNIPDITGLKNYQEFGGGTPEKVHLHYAVAKYILEKWYTPKKLKTFIDGINGGKDFESAYYD